MKNQICLLSALLVLAIACQPGSDFEIIIQNARIYNGSGSPSYQGDIGIHHGQIAKIGKDLSCSQCEIIDAGGLVASPGFVDIHAHLEPLPLLPDAQSALHMGVTTCLGGPDGSSPINLDKYLAELDAIKMGINVGYLIGHNSVRSQVLGLENRAPDDRELDDMKELIRQGMEDGAF